MTRFGSILQFLLLGTAWVGLAHGGQRVRRTWRVQPAAE